MKQKFLNFMRGRRGIDELNICLLVLYVIFAFLSFFSSIFTGLGLVCLFYAFFRTFSKNIYARQQENNAVLPYFSLFKAKFKDKGNHKIFLCPVCKRTLRIPKGKGKVTVKCPCGNSLRKKS